MLVDLKPLDVVICQGNTDGRDDDEHADTRLSFKRAAKGSSGDHDCAYVTDDNESDDEIAVDAVEHEELVAYDGYELPDHEKTGGKDGSEMNGDTDAIDAVAVPVPLAWCGTAGIATAGRAANIQIGKTGEGEGEESSGEDDD